VEAEVMEIRAPPWLAVAPPRMVRKLHLVKFQSVLGLMPVVGPMSEDP